MDADHLNQSLLQRDPHARGQKWSQLLERAGKRQDVSVGHQCTQFIDGPAVARADSGDRRDVWRITPGEAVAYCDVCLKSGQRRPGGVVEVAGHALFMKSLFVV